MPKRVHTINQFHGGLNSFSDPRDAVENQLTEANDLMVDELGKVRAFGSSTSSTNGIVKKGAADIQSGYGLMHFKHDYAGMGSTYTSGKGLKNPDAVTTSYTVLASPEVGSQKFYIYGHPQDDKIGVEIPVEVARTFPAGETTFWTNQDCTTFDDEGDLTLTADTVGMYAKLPNAKCTTNIGTAYRLSFDVGGGLIGSWFLKSYDGTQTIATISQGGTITLDFIATTVGGFRLESSVVVGSFNGITIDNISMVEGGWSQFFTLGTDDNFKMGGFVADGQIRIHDLNFDNENDSKWFGYLIRDYFETNEEYDGWYADDTEYTLPSISPTDSGASTAAGKFSYVNNSSVENMHDGSIHLEFVENATGTWMWGSGSYEKYIFYVSYIYDGGYDSGLVKLAEDSDLSGLADSPNQDNKGLTLQLTIAPSNSGADSDWFTHHSPRIIGFRLYYEKLETSLDVVSAPFCITESYFDTKKGTRLPLSNSWRKWENITYNSVDDCQRTSIYIPSPPEIITYEDINGFGHDDVTVAQFKTICIVNRKAYIGNIKRDGKVNGDMMIKSPVNGFDLFPETRSIEVSVRDGDEIIKFEEYADRILQFKRQKMHLINISQEIEFLEDTYMHKGIDYPTASCKTDFGIVWANKHGCYIYNGKNVDNLLEKQGRKMISDSDWQTHTANHISVVYMPKHRQVMVVNDLGIAGNKNVYLYDMVTASWVTSTQAMLAASNESLTNIIIDRNGDLMWGWKNISDVEFLKWDNSSSSKTSFVLKSKSMSFGSPTQRKNIYNVQIAYQGDGSAIVPTYGLNGDTTPTNTFTASTLANVGTASWTHLKLIPSSTVNNAQSFRFKLSGTAAADFAINDITVVYRLKSVK
jgi:hypothetical protein